MKSRKILSLFLSLLMILSVLPLSVFTASAQECIWSYVVYKDGNLIPEADIKAGKVTGLSISGNTLVLTDFEGESIAAKADGTIYDDDSPVLNIRLVGDNKLTGGYFKYSTSDGLTVKGNTKVTGDDCFFGALVSEPRAGGYGDDSVINISGDGTLDITLTKNYSSRTRTIGGKPTTVETRSDVDLIGIFCGKLNVNGGKVTVTYGGAGVTAAKAVGVDGNASVFDYGVLDLKANIRSATVRTNGKVKAVAATCAVYGVDGDVLSKSNNGYFSAELASVKTASADVIAVKGDISYQNALGAMYLSAPAGGKTSPGKVNTATFIENVSYRKFAFSDEKYVYEAYGPADMDDLAYNKSLSEIYAHEVTEKMTFPEIGEDKIFENNYTLYSDDGFFMRELSYKSSSAYDKYGNAQSWNSDTWTKYEQCDESFLYEFHAYVVPAAGRWYIPEAGEMDNESADKAFADLYAQDGFASRFGIFAFFKFGAPTITKQPAAVLYKGDREVSLEAPDANAYEWWMEVYDGDKLVSEFAVGDEYGDMDGYDDTDTDTMRIGGFAEDDAVPGTTDFTYGDASKVLVYCKVSSVGKIVTSNKSEYKLFEDSVVTIKTQPVNAAIDNTGKVKFTVVAEGDGLTYDWYMNNNLITSSSGKSDHYGFGGYNTASLTVIVESNMGANILAAQEFSCCVRDAHGGYAESSKVRIIDPAKAPKITSQPVNCDYIVKGTNPTFKITATGDGLTYQWYWGSYSLNDGVIGGFSTTGGKTATLTINGNGKTFGTWASWDVYCVVSNDNGSVTSNKVKIVEIEKPGFKTQPENCTVAPGSEATFKAEYEKTDGVTYQWYLEDGTALSDSDAAMWKISGAKTNTLKVTPKTPAAYAKGNFFCRAAYKGVSADSNTASVIAPHACADSTVKVAAVAPTCTTAGNKEYYKCGKCGKLYDDKDATKALTEKDVTIAALGHKWDNGVITKEATESTKGIKKYTCTVCKTTKNEPYSYVKPTEPEKPDFMYGDIDLDKKVTASDARLALRASVGLEKYEAGTVQFLAGNVDLDERISSSDARLILRFAVGLEKKLGK